MIVKQDYLFLYILYAGNISDICDISDISEFPIKAMVVAMSRAA